MLRKMSTETKSSNIEDKADSLTSCDIEGEDDKDSSFDLKVVLEGFKKCKGKDEQLYLDDYLRAYIELNRFFQTLGSVFNFVASDVLKKVTILQCLRKGGAGDFYFSIQSMMEYESDSGIVESNKQNGARTLLRLHRALEFITAFMEELGKASDDSKLGYVTSEIYSRTLAKHHSWIVAKTVGAILLLMPSKQTIIEKVTRGDLNLQAENKKILPEVINVMESVYTMTQKLYADYGMLNLV